MHAAEILSRCDQHTSHMKCPGTRVTEYHKNTFMNTVDKSKRYSKTLAAHWGVLYCKSTALTWFYWITLFKSFFPKTSLYLAFASTGCKHSLHWLVVQSSVLVLEEGFFFLSNYSISESSHTNVIAFHPATVELHSSLLLLMPNLITWKGPLEMTGSGKVPPKYFAHFHTLALQRSCQTRLSLCFL